MHWIPDDTLRFPIRPYYRLEEMDLMMERKFRAFMKKRHQRVLYPISTEEYTVFLETLVDDLDFFHDFPEELQDVEGETEFFPGKKPRVKIARRLSEDDRFENRVRFTLGHETAHVMLHARLYDRFAGASGHANTASECICRQASVPLNASDWMEIQAGYGASALLIPMRAMRYRFQDFQDRHKLSGAFPLGSSEARDFTQLMAEEFRTSITCAELRLVKAGLLIKTLPRRELLDLARAPVEPGLAHCSAMVRVLVAQYGIRV
jgi:hypothetical protein